MPENTNTATAEAQGEEQIETTELVAAPPDGDTPAPAAEAQGDGEDEDEREAQPEREPLKIVKDAEGNEWVRLYRGTKVVLLRKSQISALTFDEESGEDPLIHLANAKDVIAVNRDGWAALNTHLFGEYID